MYWYEIFTPEKLRMYWFDPVEAKRLKEEYERICIEKDLRKKDEECDCGNCYDCRYAKIFTLPEYVMPLM